MSDRYKNYGKKKKDEEEPVHVTHKEMIAKHRKNHPHDLISFGEEPIPKEKRPKMQKIPQPHPTTLLSKNDKALLDEDKEALMKLSNKNLRSMCKYMFETFMSKTELTDDDVSSGFLPIDSNGDTIHRAKGAGLGKEGFVNWLIQYDDMYRQLKKEQQLTNAMEQTLLG